VGLEKVQRTQAWFEPPSVASNEESVDDRRVTTALELSQDRLFALGATIPVDRMISWLPPDCDGHVSLNCYVVVDGSAGAIIDTSFPIIGDEIVAQAQGFRHFSTVTMLLTRIVEFDSLGNAELLDDLFPVDHIYAHFLPAHWIYFRAERQRVRPAGNYDWHMFSDGQEIPVGEGSHLVALNTRVKLLATAWIYDPATRTLFTSDSFSHVRSETPDQRVVTAEDDDCTRDDVMRHLISKFRWMDQADTEPMRRYLDEIFSSYDVDRIAPAYGCVLAGADVVQRHVSLVDEVLGDLHAAQAGRW
jgi:flavorubredoxin